MRKRRSRVSWTHFKKRKLTHEPLETHELASRTPPTSQYLSPPTAPKKPGKEKPSSARSLDFENFPPIVDNEKKDGVQKPQMKSDNQNDHYQEIITHLPALMSALSEHNLLPDFMSLIRLLATRKMSAMDLPLLLVLEKARFLSVPSTNLMKYRPQTLKFWRVVYRLLKGKAIRLFSGPKNQGAILGGQVAGTCSPKGAELNFAVPSVQILRNASGSEVPLPKEIKPGIIKEAVNIAKKSAKSYVLSMDAKKVAMGLQGENGDIDLWGHESDGGLKQRLKQLNDQLQTGQDIIMNLRGVDSQQPLADIGPDEKDKLLTKIRSFMTIISSHIRSSRQHILKQMHALDKFQKLCQTEEGALKYQYALSSTKSMLYQLRVHVTQALKVVGNIMYEASHLGMGGASASSGPLIDVGSQCNMVRLKEPQDLPAECHRPEFIKQRTEEWLALRKQARVTGSSLHNAIGLRTLKDQKLHFDVHVSGQPMPQFSPEVLERMAAGVEGEPHAAATLAAGFLPVFFPSSSLVEDGARFIRTDAGTAIEVSTDGFLLSGSQVSHIIEIKCPQPTSFSTPVQYQVPHYYVCQLLAEMASHSVQKGLFISYSPESMAISEVRFDADLWHKIVEEVDRVYGANMKRPTKLGPIVHELKTDLTTYVENNTSLLVELPSLRSTVVAEAQTTADSPYMFAAKKSTAPQVTVNKLLQSVTEGIEVVKEGYRLGRQKASEILAFVLSDVDRQQNLEIPYHLPVAYAMKGYSLPIEIARGMLKSVIETLYANGIELACLSTDGQFHKIICRGIEDRPLTLGQLQKDVWKGAVRKSKPELLAAVKTLGQGDNSSLIAVRAENSGICVVYSVDHHLRTVKTPVAPSLWKNTKSVSSLQREGPVSYWSWDDHEMSLGLMAKLKSTSPIKFGEICASELKIFTSSAERIYSTFNVKELDAIVDYLPLEMMSVKPKKSWRKIQKANALAKVFGDSNQTEMPSPIRSAGTLKRLAFQVIKDVYPKAVLSAIWAQVVWPQELEMWKQHGTVVDGINIDPLGEVHWYSQIQKYKGKLLPTCVDPSHLLTNMRVKVTKDGITGVPREAFHRVCDENPEILNKALVRDLLDKQNVAFARRVFSAAVSQKMVENGDVGAAEFVTLMREWYEAVDSPGLPAVERVLRLHNMREYLLNKHWIIDFSHFPPLGSHVKGIPYIWFDSMLQGIDTRIQMYGMIGCYSHRALGTLPVESFFGDLSDMEQTKLGCPKAIHIPRLMACTTEINSYRHDPVNR